MPGDRRRFAAYARLKGTADRICQAQRRYDLAYVTYSSDLPGWIARKRREGDRLKLVFELIDAYFTQTNPVRRLPQGHRAPAARHRQPVVAGPAADADRRVRAADAVICSTEEQRETIRRYNPNDFISFDYFATSSDRRRWTIADRQAQVVWEGQSTTLPNLQVIREPLNDLRDRSSSTSSPIRDPSLFRAVHSYPAMDALDGIECDKHFHRWDRATFLERHHGLRSCGHPDRAGERLVVGQAGEQAGSAVAIGMPVLTTATPGLSAGDGRRAGLG